MPRRPQRGPARPGSGPGSRPGRAPGPAPDRRIWVEELGFGPKATFSALFAAEMRFFKTHGFVKPLLREMLFRVDEGIGISLFHPAKRDLGNEV